MQQYHDPIFLREIWGLFIAGTIVLLLRLVVRLRTVGFRGLQGDDYFAVGGLITYACATIAVRCVYFLGTNQDFTTEYMASLTPTQQDKIALGSKLEMLGWYAYVTLMWTLKGCMLFFFYRLTAGLDLQKRVKLLGYVAALTYVGVFLALTCGCLPIEKNWQLVPDPGVQCTFSPQNLYATTSLNVLTDLTILCVPMPLLWRLELPIRKKAALSVLLFPGVFVIIAAVIRFAMSLDVNPSAKNINQWGAREAIAGIVAVNLPILRPLVLPAFWKPGFAPDKGRSILPWSEPKSGGRSSPGLPLSPYEMFHGSRFTSRMEWELAKGPTSICEVEGDLAFPDGISTRSPTLPRPISITAGDDVPSPTSLASTVGTEACFDDRAVLVETTLEQRVDQRSPSHERNEVIGLDGKPWGAMLDRARRQSTRVTIEAHKRYSGASGRSAGRKSSRKVDSGP